MYMKSDELTRLSSFKKLITGGDLSESTFTGPGEVLLAPETWGDIVPIQLDGNTPWSFSKHAFLCCTHGVTLSHKTQSLGKALCKSFHFVRPENRAQTHTFNSLRRRSVCGTSIGTGSNLCLESWRYLPEDTATRRAVDRYVGNHA